MSPQFRMRILDLDFQESMFMNVLVNNVLAGFQCEKEDQDDRVHPREINRGFLAGCILACWLCVVN
jgi:hypothetical protein